MPQHSVLSMHWPWVSCATYSKSILPSSAMAFIHGVSWHSYHVCSFHLKNSTCKIPNEFPFTPESSHVLPAWWRHTRHLAWEKSQVSIFPPWLLTHYMRRGGSLIKFRMSSLLNEEYADFTNTSFLFFLNGHASLSSIGQFFSIFSFSSSKM